MFAEERQNEIVKLVNRNGSVRVKDLSEQFQVTEDSIRKDLTLLEKKGLLRKMYGGAMQARINTRDLDHVSSTWLHFTLSRCLILPTLPGGSFSCKKYSNS